MNYQDQLKTRANSASAPGGNFKWMIRSRILTLDIIERKNFKSRRRQNS